MKHLIIYICMIFACINTAKAQMTISTSDLIGTKWQTPYQYDNQSKWYYEYTQRTKIRHKGDGSTFEYPYYLSDTIPAKFDYTKVGTNTKGCYCIELNPKSGIVYCDLILSFDKTDGTMVLQNDDNKPDTFILIPSNKPRKQYKDPPLSDNW